MVLGPSVWALVAWEIARRVCSTFVRLVCGALLLPVKFVNIMRRGGLSAYETNQGYKYKYTEYDHADHAAGDERPILSILALLVADVVAGVGFSSLIRNLLRPGPHLIERERNEYAAVYHEQQDNVRKSGKEVVEQQYQSQIDRRESQDDVFIDSIRGLRNRGQVSAIFFHSVWCASCDTYRLTASIRLVTRTRFCKHWHRLNHCTTILSSREQLQEGEYLQPCLKQ